MGPWVLIGYIRGRRYFPKIRGLRFWRFGVEGRGWSRGGGGGEGGGGGGGFGIM